MPIPVIAAVEVMPKISILFFLIVSAREARAGGAGAGTGSGSGSGADCAGKVGCGVRVGGYAPRTGRETCTILSSSAI